MPRRTYREKSVAEGSVEIRRDITRFDGGMMTGPPADKIPTNANRLLYNAVAFKDWVQGRFGTKIFSDSCSTVFPDKVSFNGAFPGMVGRTALDATKAGTTITCTDTTFTEADVGNWFVWDDGTAELIIEQLTASTVRVTSSGTNTGANCYVRGKHNGWIFHRGLKIVVVQLAHEIWVSEDITLSEWRQAICLSVSEPNNVLSDWDELDDNSVVFWNSNGIFKVILNETPYVTYRLNTNGPNSYVVETPKSGNLPYGRRYIYTCGRNNFINIIQDRQTTGVLIESESCPNTLDANFKDYGEVWTQYKRGDNTKTHGVLTGAVVANASLDAVGVWAVLTDGTINLTIDGVGYNLWCDFTGVQTMDEVAYVIETQMKIYWPDSTCRFQSGRFVLTSGEVDGTVINTVAAGTAGTDITGAGYMNVIAGTIDNTVIFARPEIIEGFRMPVPSGSPDIYERHWHVYSIYATLDVGVNGIDPISGEGNDIERYIWVKDIRVAGAFLATKTESGVVTASIGEFSEDDVGCALEWEDGDRDTIEAYLNEYQVIVNSGSDKSYGGEANAGACAIGNGRVFRASQTGNVVTRIAGDLFSVSDERKTIFWANGYRSYIIDYISSTSVRVHDEVDKAEQGMTLDPVSRNFNDRIDDDILRPRVKGFLLKNRAWVPIPLTNIGRIVPGWIFSAVRGEKTLYYSQHESGTKYLAGGHNSAQESEDAKDVIQAIVEGNGRIVVVCANSVYGGPTNTSIPIEVSGTGEFVNLFSGLQVLDANVGVEDFGSIRLLTLGQFFAITNEPAARIFDGFKWLNNLAEDKDGRELVMDELREWAKATATGYKDGVLYLWGLK